MSLDNALNNEVQDPTEEDPAALPQRSELEVLQERATQLGLKFRSNTGVDKLRAMVNAAIEGETIVDEEEEVSETAIPQPSALAAAAEEAETPNQRKRRQRNEARKLVRCRITCHNPNKTEWESEIFTFGNDVVGTLRRCVPFETDWHVEAALLNMIKARNYQHFYNAKDPSTGKTYRTSKQVREFAVEILPPLTEAELEDLRQAQAARGTLD
ncbi:hypothetical protein AVU12_gp006 [Pseudomonas phage KPP21]|uniref:Uncharacterized protein n=1 Tax=Pseudomonas phage KPP21 TaxID=1678082 RepID=A0A0H5B0X1_BPK21|nr:hypothetical protein AVU12_gp006 [Pseudomonas phage KPP21]UGL60888.1 hypothetical protein [Pseudomonas phage vB_PaeS_TUMS_P6]BAR94565.1 hypothetical protein [Pseudomonas phage KPP21]